MSLGMSFPRNPVHFVILLGVLVWDAEVSGSSNEDLLSSSFIEAWVKNQGVVPYPFNRYKEKMRVSDYDPGEVIIPAGRSLQKKKTTFENPRAVVADGSSRLFTAYAPLAKQLEIISWNQKRSQFDFFIVTNYAKGLVPKITLPERNLCITCHQGGGPIFPHAGWNETDAAARLVERMVAARNGKVDFDGYDLVRGNGGSLGTANFDRSIRAANRLGQSAQVCRTVCGDDIGCREALVKTALLNPGIGAGQSPDPDWLESLRSRVEKHWPKDEFAYVSSVIPDRNPLKNEEQGGTATRFIVKDPQSAIEILNTPISISGYDVKGVFETLTALPFGDMTKKGDPAFIMKRQLNDAISTDSGLDLTYDEEAGNGFTPMIGDNATAEDRKKYRTGNKYAEEFIATEGSQADPKFQRPKVSAVHRDDAIPYIIDHGWNCVGFNAGDVAVLVPYNDKIKDAVVSLDIKDLVSRWPPERGKILRRLLTKLGATEIPLPYRDGEIGEAVPKKLRLELEKISASPPLEQSEIAETYGKLKQFIQYCSSCHAGANTPYPLPLNDLSKLKLYRSDDGVTVYDQLHSGRMPPKGSKYSKPSKEEREQMLKLLHDDL